jgi:hypothetical protein
MGLWTRIRLIDLIAVRLNLSRKRCGKVKYSAAPERALGKSAERELRYDAEVIPAAAEGTEEVGIFLLIRIDNVTIGKYDFVIRNVIADEAFAGGEER